MVSPIKKTPNFKQIKLLWMCTAQSMLYILTFTSRKTESPDVFHEIKPEQEPVGPSDAEQIWTHCAGTWRRNTTQEQTEHIGCSLSYKKQRGSMWQTI